MYMRYPNLYTLKFSKKCTLFSQQKRPKKIS